MRLPKKNTKDQLRNYADKHGPVLTAENLGERLAKPPCGELELWTYHADEVEPARFAVFKYGQPELPRSSDQSSPWGRPFTGRPELIAELFPKLESELAGKAASTVSGAQAAMRDWWRLLDSVERSGAAPVGSVADFNDLHRQRAFDCGMSSKHFSWFINRAVNPTRAVLRSLGMRGMEELHWKAPERPVSGALERVLPEIEMVDPIRIALKHGWFAALYRWERTETLLKLGRPRTLAEAELGEEGRLDDFGWRRNAARIQEESRLLKQYQHYEIAVRNLNGRVPCTGPEAKGGLTTKANTIATQNLTEMQRGFFPDGDDIRLAFMLCLAATGWNPQTLLDLDATKCGEFIVEHPRNEPEDERGHQYLMKGVSDDPEDAPVDEEDGSFYSMTGWKERARHEVYTEGLKKSRASAPVIILALIDRTVPLRERLKERADHLKAHYFTLQAQGADLSILRKAHKALSKAEQGIRSPWLFCSFGRIFWLNNASYDNMRQGRWLRSLITALNAKRSLDRQLPYIVATDFRKIFGSYWYRTSNGDILQVQKALGHLAISTTQGYLRNNLIRQQSNKTWRVFLQHFWEGVQTGVVDPTLLAKLCKDGDIAPDEKQRLLGYRELQRSRIGVPCKDPYNPPKNIDANFVPDGESMCVAQRCTLCQANAVLAPDSWPGLCMRIAELRHLQAELPMEVFSTAGSFSIELRNTERAMLAFPDQPIEEQIMLWTTRIANGEHVPPELI